jgi:hypothetical protein
VIVSLCLACPLSVQISENRMSLNKTKKSWI